MSEFNRENVSKALAEIIAEKGEDYVYPPAKTGVTCRYADEQGNPSCLVGHVVARLDPQKFEQLADWEQETGGGAWWEPADVLGLGGGQDYLTEALASAQAEQDSGKTWGEALRMYNDTLRNLDDLDRHPPHHDDEEAEDDQ